MLKNTKGLLEKRRISLSTPVPTISVLTAAQLPRNTVKKSHTLLMKEHDLNSTQSDMLLLFMSKLDTQTYELPELEPGVPQEEQDKALHVPTIKFEADVLEEWFGVSRRQMASKLVRPANGLAQQNFSYQVVSEGGNELTEFTFRPLFSNVSYSKGTLTFIPNVLMFRLMVDYSKGFALINHVAFRELKSEYSKRLYELLSRWREPHNPMRPMLIKELQTLFGIYDAKGNEVKPSLARPNLFIERVIKPSIKELAGKKIVNKELLLHFDTDDDKTLGYRAYKKGKGYHSIKFLYQWINQKSAEQMDVEEALKLIKKLDIDKRLVKKQRLTVDDLTNLYIAYSQVGQDDKAAQVLKALRKKKNENDNEMLSQKNDLTQQAINKVIDSISLLESTFNDDVPEY